MQTPDLFFLSYCESNAELNWQSLLARFPHAKRLHGVCGVYRAHALIAECAESNFYFVIDGDNEVDESFHFDIPFEPQKNSLYVWRAKNPVNDLVYGFGGIKLYNRSLFASKKQTGADIATTITPHYVPVMEMASTTRFNSTPLESWRGAFRECAKLVQNLQKNSSDSASHKRLQTWLALGRERLNGSWCLLGAQQGVEFARQRLQQNLDLLPINDFAWLDQEFLKNKKITPDSFLSLEL